MAINLDKFSEQVFKVIKGHGAVLELFTDDGRSTVDPAEARRFYCKDTKVMVNIEDTDEKTELKVSVSASTDIESIKPLLNNLRNLASRNIIEYTLRTFGKDIEPRDFAYQAKAAAAEPVQESLSKPYGSTRSSYQTLESARIIIRHRKHVDEEVRGSRSRNINAIFIENAEGERYKFPYINLNGARAMLRHIREGGNPYDQFGSYITRLAEEHAQLQKFRSFAKRNSLISEDTGGVFEGVSNRLDSIRKQFKSLSSTKGYKQYRESYRDTKHSLEEENVNIITDKFSESVFDEEISQALPHVARVVRELSDNKNRSDRLKSFVNKVMERAVFALSEPLNPADPDHPDNRQFENQIDRLSGSSAYLSQYVVDEDIRSMLGQLGEDIADLDARQLTIVEKLLTYLYSSVKVQESRTTESVKDAVTSVVDAIEDSLKKLDTQNFLN